MEATIMFIIVMAIYMLPAIIAYNRKSTVSGVILLLNLFTGWLFITWLIYLIWASSSETIQDVELRKAQLENLKSKK